jgi:glycosyltransferase involved in cell wall biosynthesis
VKGVTYLADAFARLVREGSAARLTILGGGLPAETIRAQFSPAARPFLTIVPRAPEEQVMAAYRTHDVLAWPSTYEGFGMVVIEAMSQRLPVVATPVGCAQSLIVAERTGLLVPPRDGAALAAALDRMVRDSGLSRRCASAAFEQVRDMSWTNTARRTLDVYADALGGNGHVH